MSPAIIVLRQVGRTRIEAANGYSENTSLRITVVYPPGHPRAGAPFRDFNGVVTISERDVSDSQGPGTNYYDGQHGATQLPVEVPCREGQGELTIKSTSPTESVPLLPAEVLYPADAIIQGSAPDAEGDQPSARIRVRQWVDENRNAFVDWLEQWATDILDQARRSRDDEVATVARAVRESSSRMDSHRVAYRLAGTPQETIPGCSAVTSSASHPGVAPLPRPTGAILTTN